MDIAASSETEALDYGVCIRPFKQKQDHEDMNVNVKSLVSIFEHEDDGADFCSYHDNSGVLGGKELPDIIQCSAEFPDDPESASGEVHQCRVPEKVINEDPAVTLLAVKKKDSKRALANGSTSSTREESSKLFSDQPHFVKNKIVTKYVVKEKIGHDLRRCFSDSWGTYALTDDAALLEALKDVIDKPAVIKGGKTEKKSKRIRLPKKSPTPSKPFQEQVKDIFNPEKATSTGTLSSDSENDSEHGYRKEGVHSPVGLKCEGTCQGTYNVPEATGGYRALRCSVCSLLKDDNAKVKTSEAKTDDERTSTGLVQPVTDVVNIVLVERSSQLFQWPPAAESNLQSKPPKVSKRRKETVERKVFEWQFGNNQHLAQNFAPVVSELGALNKPDKASSQQLPGDTGSSRAENDSVSSVETEYEYALTDITTDERKLKERSRSASSLEATDLDFSVIESSSQLDVGVSKDRAILRQKGSLAKRRKPTRSSMRSRGNEEDMFAVDIPVDNDQEDNRNEHDDEAKEPVHEKEEVKKAPMRNSFLLPGLGEQPKLRSKPRVPLPNITTPVTATVSMTTNESNPPETSTPGWMVEARLRRQSRTPTEETTNLTRDPEAGKPEWMREALAKKRRSMDMQQRKEWRVKEEEKKNISAPWVKERPLKHIEQEPVDQTMTIDNKNSSRSSPDIGGATIFVSSSRLDSSPNFDTPSKYAVDRKLDSLSISKSEKDMLNEKDIKNGNNKWLSDSPRSRDLLTPIKDNSVDMNLNPVETQDENTPPRKNSTTGSDYQTSAVISSLEQSGSSSILRNKSKLPPLNKTSSSTNHNVETVEAEDSVPSWKAEIQLRRRSKVFTQIKKPDQPIRLGETPQWKLDLAERTKTKKDDVDVPKPKTDILTQTTTPQPSTTPSTVPPWQREVADRKKRNSLNPKALEPLEKTSAKEEPEWAGLAEKRRSRLANSGLVKT